MRPGPLVAFLILVAAAGVLLFSFSGATVPHVTVGQAKGLRGTTVQVPGRIDKRTVQFRVVRNQPELRFEITDLQGGKERMTIVYQKPRPENFHNATSVEAIGRYEDGVFVANTLLVKCPSKYQGQAE